jgi:hypothetical protein
MGRKNSRSNRSSEKDNSRESSDSEDGLRNKRPPKSAEKKGSAGPNTSGATGLREAERYYGQEFDSIDEVRAIQHKEEAFGGVVFRWLDEGIPIEAMGNTDQMDAYRERKGTPVPWDAEKRNKKSARRSRINARDTGPAGETGVPDSVRQVVSSPGQSLDADVQRTMEDKMGDSFSDVQIHTGPKAAKACEDINAKAFTVGNNIAFNRGEYDPTSQEGQHVLAHELAHVRQQTGGAVSMLPQNDVEMEIDPDPESEEQADQTAQKALNSGTLVTVSRLDMDVHIQRHHKDQVRRDNGEFGKLKEEVAEQRTRREEKPYGHDRRPDYAPGQREEVWEREKDPNGIVYCAVKDVPLDRDNWCMGHKPRREYRYLVEYYLRGIISREEFLAEYRNPDHYQPECHRASSAGEHEREGGYWADKWGDLE